MAIAPSGRRQKDAILEGAAVGCIGQLEAVVKQPDSIAIKYECLKFFTRSYPVLTLFARRFRGFSL